MLALYQHVLVASFIKDLKSKPFNRANKEKTLQIHGWA